ncbi:MAG: metallophosphoesterase [Deltaproteobacteria bacterium]
MRLATVSLVVPLASLLVACGAASHTGDGDPPTDAARDTATPDVRSDVAPDGVAPDDVAGADAAADAQPDARADVVTDTGTVFPPIGPTGGSVDRLHFAVFGDVRPPIPDQTSAYPTMIVTSVMDGIESGHAQFVIGTGDYMNENFCASCATDQIALLQSAERHYTGYVFHGMGNHECLTITSVNCPNQNESVALRTFKTTLLPTRVNVYYDWHVQTSSGDAHFIATDPNAWNAEQQTWLDTVLAQPARYTFVVAHEPPSAPGPGTAAIEASIATRTGGVTLRMYGHVHRYEHPVPNGIVTGNAGAPLSSWDTYGYAVIDQRDDDNIVVTAYAVGSPPSPIDSFVLTPDGALTH